MLDTLSKQYDFDLDALNWAYGGPGTGLRICYSGSLQSLCQIREQIGKRC